MSRETCTEKRAETRSGMNILHEMLPGDGKSWAESEASGSY